MSHVINASPRDWGEEILKVIKRKGYPDLDAMFGNEWTDDWNREWKNYRDHDMGEIPHDPEDLLALFRKVTGDPVHEDQFYIRVLREVSNDFAFNAMTDAGGNELEEILDKAAECSREAMKDPSKITLDGHLNPSNDALGATLQWLVLHEGREKNYDHHMYEEYKKKPGTIPEYQEWKEQKERERKQHRNRRNEYEGWVKGKASKLIGDSIVSDKDALDVSGRFSGAAYLDIRDIGKIVYRKRRDLAVIERNRPWYQKKWALAKKVISDCIIITRELLVRVIRSGFRILVPGIILAIVTFLVVNSL